MLRDRRLRMVYGRRLSTRSMDGAEMEMNQGGCPSRMRGPMQSIALAAMLIGMTGMATNLAWGQPPREGAPAPVISQRSVMTVLSSLEPYRVDGELEGKVQLAGSGSVAALSQMWAESLHEFHKSFDIEATGGGSESGLSHLSEKPGTMVSVTRPMEADDLQKLKAAGIHKPIAIVVGLDAMAIFVHKNNPLAKISPPELQRIFSEQAPGGKIEKWGQLGLPAPWADQPIHVQARGTSSGTRTFTEKYLLGGLPLRADATVCESNADLVKNVTEDEAAIAVAPLYLQKPEAKMLAIQLERTVVQPDEATILQGRYPVVRPVVLVFDSAGPPEAVNLNKQFLRFVLSREGQLDVVKSGYFPLNPAQLRQQQDALGFERFR